jgi:hypothetical protein
VGRNRDGILEVAQQIINDRFALSLAKDDANGGLIVLATLLIIDG